jgi:hypothetical protein
MTAFQIRFRDDSGKLLTLSEREKFDLTDKLRNLLDVLNAELDTTVRYRLTVEENPDA